jgi:hypothetical protein
MLKHQAGCVLHLLAELARDRARINLAEHSYFNEFIKSLWLCHQKVVALGVGYDWANLVAHQLKQRALAAERDDLVRELYERIRAVFNSRRALRPANVAYDIVREAKLASEYDPRAAL